MDDLFDILAIAPFWLGPLLALISFVLIRYLAPLFFVGQPGGVDLSSLAAALLPILSWMISGAIMLTWGAAEVRKLFDRRLLDQQSGPESIRSLSWPEFERLVCEAYRRRGYLATVVGSSNGDGGVDVMLSRPDEKIVVQCKQWRVYTVGVPVVRELLGTVVAHRATKGIVVTSGRFTRDALRFAESNPQVELVDGEALADLVAEVRAGADERGAEDLSHASPNPPAIPASPAPACPTCGSTMVKRVAKRGAQAGSMFWGCSRYPGCRGTRPI